jgi:hypothetical protein
MDGALFTPHLIKDEKGYHHLDAPYYGLCPNMAQAGRLQEKVWPLAQLDFFM